MAKTDPKSLTITIHLYAGWKDKQGKRHSLPAGQAFAEGQVYIRKNASRGAMASKPGVQFNGLDAIPAKLRKALKAHKIELTGKYAE